ncbi:phage tail protein [Tianweitania sediminis]|uniref:Phage tail protein n=1 Tax=Tianweitania sediminis TaxID=1502156 RepID=A0A8J7UJ32_9HYPH|nr:phage tail protein [Tianweitania sediminis]MBP0439578.1 phage tail protein [Tianweitania sediminis]
MAIFSGIAAAIGGVFSAVSGFIASSAIGAFVLQTAAGIGLNLLAKAIAGKPQEAQFSVQGKLQSGGDLPRSFILGFGATAGSLVYVNTWGEENKTPNAYLTQVIALSDLPVSGLAELWVNGEKVTIDWSNGTYEQGFPVLEYRTDETNNHLWVRFYDGNQAGPDTFLVNRVSSAERPWGSSRVGRGVAYAVVTAQINEELFSGFPQFKFVLNGVKLYDPSRDSTRGGSGSHRLGTPSTWGGDGDHLPAVQAYNLLLGLTYNAAWFYGLQSVAAARLPVADWIAQINKCRAPIAGPYGSEPTYRTGGEIQVAAPLADAIEAVLTGAQGRLAEIGGTYKIHVGAPDAPVASIDDGVILSTEPQSFSPFFGLADTINGVAATYPEPAEGWVPKPAPALYRADLEARDGNRRLMADVSLDLVPYPGQVQRLMKSALEEAQRARRHTIVLPPEYGVLEPGVDTIAWTSPRNGYITKHFRVDGVADRANLDVMVDLTEVDPNDYDWNQNTDYRTPVNGPVGPIRPAPQIIVDWYAEGAVLYDESGIARRAAIKLSWDGEQPDVAAVVFEVRLAATEEVIYRGRTDNPAAGSILISQNLLPLTAYGVRGRYEPRSSRPTLWSGWLPVTTPDIRLTDRDVYLPGMLEEIQQHILRMTEFATTGSRAAIERIRQLMLDEENEASSNFIDRKVIREEVELKIEDTRAFVGESIILAIGPDGVITAVLNEMSAEFETGLATIDQLVQTEVSRIDGVLVATAQSIDVLEAQVDDVSASINIRATATAGGPSGGARYAVQVQHGSAGNFVSSALFLEATSGGLGYAGFVADRFYIANPTSPGSKFTPFVFQDGVMRVNAAVLASLIVGEIDAINIKAHSIDTDQLKIGGVDTTALALQAATTASVVANSAAVSGGWSTACQTSVSMAVGGTLFVLFTCRVDATSTDGSAFASIVARILINGGEYMQVVAGQSNGGTGNISGGSFSFVFPIAVGSGTFTVALQFSTTASTGASASASYSRLGVFGVKR